MAMSGVWMHIYCVRLHRLVFVCQIIAILTNVITFANVKQSRITQQLNIQLDWFGLTWVRLCFILTLLVLLCALCKSAIWSIQTVVTWQFSSAETKRPKEKMHIMCRAYSPAAIFSPFYKNGSNTEYIKEFNHLPVPVNSNTHTHTQKGNPLISSLYLFVFFCWFSLLSFCFFTNSIHRCLSVWLIHTYTKRLQRSNVIHNQVTNVIVWVCDSFFSIPHSLIEFRFLHNFFELLYWVGVSSTLLHSIDWWA